MLRARHDVLIEVVRISISEDSVTHASIEDKVLASACLQSCDVLDAEAVCIEPGEENFTHDSLYTLFREA